MSRQAYVYSRDRLAGMLSEMLGGGYRFAYDPAYIADGTAISLTLPLQTEPFESSELFPFFAGLVPEGWYLRIVAQTIKVDENDKITRLGEYANNLKIFSAFEGKSCFVKPNIVSSEGYPTTTDPDVMRFVLERLKRVCPRLESGDCSAQGSPTLPSIIACGFYFL